jgi:hypothetical protein
MMSKSIRRKIWIWSWLKLFKAAALAGPRRAGHRLS